MIRFVLVVDDRTRVIFIAGWGRSGSTILANILGQLDGFFSVGELHYLWDRGILQNRRCGCGEVFHACPIWSRVCANYLAAPESVIPLVSARRRIRMRDAWRTALFGSRERLHAEIDRYVEAVAEVISRLRAETGSNVIVDSSKNPSHGYVLSRVPGIDLHLVHLVRDPRAVAFSWNRRKLYEERDEGPVFIRRSGPLRSTAYWIGANVLSEIWLKGNEGVRYRRLRYEDFVRNPREEVASIEQWAGGGVSARAATVFADSHTVQLGETHEVSGNPVRFQTGRIEIHSDDEWRSGMPRKQRSIVTALGLPMMLRYGYLRSYNAKARIE